MDSNLLTQLTLFANGYVQGVLVRTRELSMAAAWLACNGLERYQVNAVEIDGEDWYQLSPVSEPLWGTVSPLIQTSFQ